MTSLPVRVGFWLTILGLAGLSVVYWPLSAPSQAQSLAGTLGYYGRPSGFDLNFNGTPGEAGTADVAVCDAQGDSASTVGEDLDGNAVADRQVYVDLSSGTNSVTCGLPGTACRTIAYAMAGTNASVTGGPIGTPSATQMQAICFKGTGRELVVPSQSGATGSYSLAQTGFQARTFNLPRYPFLLSGWDNDNDNQYPPHDLDDTAVLDGNSGGASLNHAIENTAPVSYIEYAHFTAKDYGLVLSDDIGFMQVARGGGTATNIYVHDLRLIDIMRGMTNANTSGHILFDFFANGTVSTYTAIVNVHATDIGGGYGIRGSGVGTSVLGPYRFQNITMTTRGAAGDYWAAIKLWDYVTGVEVLGNFFDLNPDVWSPGAVGGAPSSGVGISYCSQDWVVRGNAFHDFKQFVTLSPYYGVPGTCESRPLDEIRIDRNIFRNTYAPWVFGDWGLLVEAGNSVADSVEDVYITNNRFSSTQGWEACLWLRPGNPSGADPSNIRVAGNTCYGAINRHAALTIGNAEGAEPAFPGQTFTIQDNVFAALGSVLAVDWQYSPSSWIANGQAYDASATFRITGTGHTFASWKTATGQDAASKQCTPSFVAASTGNFRLVDADTCADAAGVDISAITTVDHDGVTRSVSTPAIGAHEYVP